MSTLRPVTDLSARRCAREAAVSRTAGAPVLHVTPSFLDALNCRGAWAPDWRGAWAPDAEVAERRRPRLSAV